MRILFQRLINQNLMDFPNGTVKNKEMHRQLEFLYRFKKLGRRNVSQLKIYQWTKLKDYWMEQTLHLNNNNNNI